MALWYHDAVYDPRSGDNEVRSAEVARQAASAMGLPRELADRVAGLILVSTHRSVAASPDAQLFADIDLAILGRPTAVFAEYERQVRQEYSWVPDREFRSARSAILRSFLERPSIYATSHFRRKYEEPARLNLSVSLKNLR
jgi:predicted metal-dependent HD superfamily phosphohydrolase